MASFSLDGRSDAEHQQRAAVILDGMSQFVALLNPQGDILVVNRAALEGAGHRIEEIRGKPFWTARWWQISENARRKLQVAIRCAAGGDFVHYEVDIYGEQSGRVPITIDFSLQPLRGETGEIEYLLAEGRNISERRRGEEQLAHQGFAGLIGSVIDSRDRIQTMEASALLSAIVDSSDDAIISKDLTGVITSWNKSAERLFGYSADEAIGRSITMLIPADRFDEEPKILEQLKRGERVDHFETIRVRKDGARLNISLTISPVRDASGRIVGASKVARDITERKQAEIALSNRHAQFETLLHESPFGVYLVDADFRIREVNPVARPVFGDIPNLIGRDFDEVIHRLWEKRYADEIVAIFHHTLETGEAYISPERQEVRVDRGTTEYYQWRVSRITLEDGRYGVVCYFHDISAQVEARNALRDYAFELKDADRRKDEFLATLAHELRNPLAPIRNAVELLKRPDLTAENFSIARHITESQLNHMVRLVDDLLDISRISSGKIGLRKERVTLKSIVDQALQTSQPHVQAAGHRVSLSLPPSAVYLHGDPVRLAQVLSNLINNACKYSENNGRIEIVASLEPESASDEWQVASDATETEKSDEGATLPGAEGLAEVHGSRGTMLRRYQKISQPRTVWTGQSNSPSGRVDTSEHRRGPGSTTHEGVSKLSERGAGIADGTGNAPVAEPTSRPSLSADSGVALGGLRRDQPNADGSSTSAASEIVTSKAEVASDESRVASKGEVAIDAPAHHSSLTTHHSPDHSPLTTHHLLISVKDTGIGIAAEHLARIFELFSQIGTALDRSQGGLGIGLALVRGLVELHGGSVEARSEGLGKGSVFIVRLPIPPSVEEEWVEHSGDDGFLNIAAAGKRILVVDDNRVQAKSLGILLEYGGHEVKIAHDGPSALAILDGFVPDIALIDVGLPHGMTGHDLARQIRAQQRFDKAVLIAQTGWGRDEDRERSRAAGFDHHIVKPIDHDQLQRIIDGTH